MSTPSINLIREFTDEHVGLIFGYFIVNIITLILETIILSIILSKIFNAFTNKQDIKKLLLMYVGIYLIVRIGYYFKNLLYDEIIPEFFNFIRVKIYDNILNRYEIDYKELNTGYILYNFEHLPQSFKNLIIELLQEYIPNLIALVVCLCYLFYVNKTIGIIILSGIIIFIIIVVSTLNKSIYLSAAEHKAFKNNSEHIQERLNNLYDIYTSGTKDEEQIEYKNMEDIVEEKMKNNYKYISNVTLIIEIFTAVVLFSSFYVFYHAYNNKTISNEQLITTILVLTYYLSYFCRISNNYIGLTDVFGYSKESDLFLNEITLKQIQSQIQMQQPLYSQQRLQFNNINFSYGNKKILKNINLIIEPNTKIAIYGKSGSGKSTLIKLLLGFYTPDSGSIIINGVNIKDIGTYNLRKNISVLNQNIKLFDKTIYENIKYGITDKNDNELNNIIDKLLKNINIFEGVSLEEKVGVAGSKLSGGQKQIINIIRTILRNTPILIFDEPTSALDEKTKNNIINLINEIQNKTIIIITHDKNLIQYVDKVYKLIDGKLIS